MNDQVSSVFYETASPNESEEMRLAASRWRLLFALTVGLVVAALWGAWLESTAYDKRQAMTATARRQLNLAIAAEHFVVRVLRNSEAVMQFLGRNWLTAPSNDVFAAAVADRVRNNDAITEIVVCFDNRTLLTSSDVAAPRDAWCTAWMAAGAALDRGTVVAKQVTRGTNVLVPLATRLPEREGHPGGIVVSLVGVQRLLGLLQDYRIHERTVVLLAGTDGVVRARWDSATGTSDQRAPEAELVRNGDGHVPALASVREVGGRTVVYSTRAVRGYPLYTAVATDQADVFAESERRKLIYGVACALISVLLGLLAVLLWRQYGRAGRMAVSLGRARERLQVLNADLESKVNRRTRELEAAYRDLESFSYTVAHDVRAPIAAIRGFADAMAPALAAKGDPKLDHYLRRITANAVQMSEFTESLLALGKLARAPVQPVPVDLSAMAAQVLQGLREADTGREVDADVQPGIFVMADRILMRQVLENLLGNAWKFTARKSPGVIRVNASDDALPGWVTVRVSDNGAGFDDENATDLFKPFRRMHTSEEFPGTGVGLAAVERIVRLHGGRIWMQSRVGAGATAFITLPAVPPPDSAPQEES